MKRTCNVLVALVLATTMLLAACGAPAPASSSGAMPQSPATVSKIISLAPSNTDILVAIGCGDSIVAIDTYSAGKAGLPADLPQFDMIQPDAEQLIALEPDVVFTTGMSMAVGEDPFKPLRDVGIKVIDIATANSIDEILQSITDIGEATGSQGNATALVVATRAELDKIKKIGDTVTDKRSVYFEISPAPAPYSFGKGVFLHEMLELIGATNVLGEQDGWLPVSEEVVLAANPDVILTNVNFGGDPVAELTTRNGWGSVNAVKQGKIYVIDNNASSQPSHNMVIALREMALAVYPEYYGDK